MQKSEFELIFKEHYDSLVIYAENLCHDSEMAKDLTQNCFLKLWKRGWHIKITDTKKFLYRSIKNEFYDLYRHDKVKRIATKEILHLTDEAIFQRDVRNAELTYKIFKAVEELPEQTRKIFLLHLEGYSTNEIIDNGGVSVRNVLNLKSYAIKLLRHKLRQYKHELING